MVFCTAGRIAHDRVASSRAAPFNQLCIDAADAGA
jgi:hypothetical protein